MPEPKTREDRFSPVDNDLPTIEARILAVQEALESPGEADLSGLMAGTPPGDIAAVLEALPPAIRERFWEQVPESRHGDVLAALGEQVRDNLLRRLEVQEAAAAVATMATPDLTAVVHEAPADLREAILESLGARERALVEDTLGYDEDTAGRLMEREWVAVRGDVTLEVVKRYLQYRRSLPERSDTLMVVDRDQVLVGALPLGRLLTEPGHRSVAEVMDADPDQVSVDTPLDEVARQFRRHDLVSLPVVDSNRRPVGRIILDDAIALIRSQAEAPMMRMAGMEVDEDLLAPIAASARRRLLWLGINLMTAFLAAWVIGLFEATLDQIVALAVLMPIVASMGGIAGSQTLTLAIRGLALGQITDANSRWLATKEIVISAINGVVWALVVGAVAWLWFGSPGIAVVLGVAMVINLLVAAASALAIPLALRRLGIDAALSGSVLLTTITDVVGFMSFLGLATLFLL